jgi:hypothetical protein
VVSLAQRNGLLRRTLLENPYGPTSWTAVYAACAIVCVAIGRPSGYAGSSATLSQGAGPTEFPLDTETHPHAALLSVA